MDLYKHTTSGGAEYYCLNYVTAPDGTKEGRFPAVLRVDGGEIEVFTKVLKEHNIKLIIK